MMRLVGLLLLALAVNAQVPSYPPSVLASMNLSADPCEDFYNYACGTWIAQTVLPPSKPIVEKAITSIEDINEQVLQNIVKTIADDKVAPFYQNCMDRAQIDYLGFGPAQEYYEFISNVTSLDDFMFFVGFLTSYEIPILFSMSVAADPMNPTLYMAEFDQGGFLLPQEAYLQPGTLLTDYGSHITRMFQLVGDSQSDAKTKAQLIVQLETLFAQNALPLDKIRDPYSVYHKIDLNGLEDLTPNLNWLAYQEGMIQNFTSINVAEPTFFAALDQILTGASIPALTAYLQWNLIHNSNDLMPTAFVNETFAFFGVELNGQQEMEPLESICIDSTGNALGDILAKYFIEQRFPQSAYNFTNTMVSEIMDAFKQDLLNLDWMDNTTRTQALLKLSEVTRRVGYPDHFKTYDNYLIYPGYYLESVFEARALDFSTQAALIGGPVDRSAWEMFAYIVNAYYEPTSNSINFPAGIMQNPYFDMTQDPAMNFGGVGLIMGHELTHGFDDQGRMYDGNGKLDDWWQPSTAAQFQAKAKCLVDQYSKFEILPGVFVNGNLTLGENIADNGGMKSTVTAYQNLVGSQNANLPLLFVAYAQGWCAKATPEFQKFRAETDVHSPPQFRAVGPLINHPLFAQTFQCKVGSFMNPPTRCEVW